MRSITTHHQRTFKEISIVRSLITTSRSLQTNLAQTLSLWSWIFTFRLEKDSIEVLTSFAEERLISKRKILFHPILASLGLFIQEWIIYSMEYIIWSNICSTHHRYEFNTRIVLCVCLFAFITLNRWNDFFASLIFQSVNLILKLISILSVRQCQSVDNSR